MPLPNIMQSCSICGMEYENTPICTLWGGSVKNNLKDYQNKAKSLEKKIPFDISDSPANDIFSPIPFDLKHAPQYLISPIILFGIDYAPN